MSALKKNFGALYNSVKRRHKELEDMLKDPNKVERTIRVKMKDLLANCDKMAEAASAYVDSADIDKTTSEKVDELEVSLKDAVEEVAEKSKDFLREEEFKNDILQRSMSLVETEKVIIKNIVSAEKSAKEYDASKPMSSVMYETLKERFSALEIKLEKHSEGYLELMRNNPEKKTDYVQKLEELKAHFEKISEVGLLLAISVEKKEQEPKTRSTVTSLFSNPPPQSIGSRMPTLPSLEVKPSGQEDSSGAGGGSLQAPVAGYGQDGNNAAQNLGGQTGARMPRLQLEKLKPPVFSGDVCRYAAWKKQWREMVHPCCTGEVDELYRMQGAMVTRDLKMVLESFQSLTDAWAYLDDKYGRADVAAVMMITEFKQMELGKGGDHEKFMKLQEKFKNLATNLHEIGQLASLNSLFEVNLIVSMLPGEMKTKFAEFKSVNMHMAGYSLLAGFMDHQVIISRECVVALQHIVGSSQGGGKANKKEIQCYKCHEYGHYAVDCDKKLGVPRGVLKAHGLSAKPVNCPVCGESHKITEGKNIGKYKTRLSSCGTFRDMSVNERGGGMEAAQACILCTDWTHQRDKCDAKVNGQPWQGCVVKDSNGQKCGKKHHNLLHGSTHKYLCMIVAVKRSEPVRDRPAEGGDAQVVGHCGQALPAVDGCEVLLLMMRVPVLAGPTKTVMGLAFFDGGSSMSLIREDFATRLSLVGRKIILSVQVVGQDWTQWHTTQYAVTVLDKYGKKHLIRAYSIDSITSPIDKVVLDGVLCRFPNVRPAMIERPEGQVDLLVGLDRSSIHPKAVTSVGDLTLYESVFGSGVLVGGTDPELKTNTVVFGAKANKLRSAMFGQLVGARKLNYVKKMGRPILDFLEAEELGTVQPKRCTSCLSCGDCSNKAVEMSRKQQAELRLIEESVTIDKDLQKVEVKYPAIKDFGVLTDNREQVIARAKSLEKRLLRTGMKEKYDGQLKDFIARGAIVEMSDEEMKEYDGPVNYIDHHGVLSDSATTPYRFVVNSSLDNNNSGVSLNDCIPKGPNSIKSLLGCIITFRSETHVVVFDLSKCYQQMHTGKQEKHLRRIVWRFSSSDMWSTFGFVRVTYGDRIAACALEVAKKLIFEWGKEVCPNTAHKVGLADYVDDCNAGADTTEEIDAFIGEVIKDGDKFKYTGTISQILGLVKWSAKVMVRDGETDPDAIAKIKSQYLGLNWDPTLDVFKYKLKVNLTPKVRGVRPGNPRDITMENLEELDNKVLTLRIVASVVYSWYDPPGLFCPITLKYKLLLSDTIAAGVDWKDELPGELQVLWKKALMEVVQMPEVTFKRSFKPEGVEGPPMLVGYFDGSKKGFGCCLYIRWKLKQPRVECDEVIEKTSSSLEEENRRRCPVATGIKRNESCPVAIPTDQGEMNLPKCTNTGVVGTSPGKVSTDQDLVRYHVQLVVAKAKIAKTGKVPRNELDALVMLSRLVTDILPWLVLKPSSLLIIGDSICTIQSVEAEAKVLKDFFNNRCEEVNEHVKQWERDGIKVEPLHYTPSKENISDLATKGEAHVKDVDEYSEWQNGKHYLRFEMDDSWPISRVSGQDSVPEEEKIVSLFSAILSRYIPAITREQHIEESWQMRVPNITKFGAEYWVQKFDFIRWVAERHRDLLKVLRILARLIAVSAVKKKPSILEEPSVERLEKARALLEIVYGEDTAKEVVNGKLVGLDPVLSKGRYVTRGRFGQGIALVLGLEELPILMNYSYLAYLVMVSAHNETHNEAKSTLARSRSQAWVVRGLSLAKRVCSECTVCRLDRKKVLEQKMGYLPQERFQTGFPPFTNVSLDLAAPLLVLDMVRKRSKMKCWPVIMCCLNTGAVHLELLHTYGAEAFLLRWKVFTSIRGDPKLVVSDMGSQLRAAAQVVDWSKKEDPAKWNWERIKEMTANRGTVWRFVPAGCQWQNGLAESRIKIFKQTLKRCVVGTINGNKSLLSYGEMQVLLAEMMDKMNNRPIGLKQLTEELLVPLTPNCLLLGRTSTRVSTLGEASYEVEDYKGRLRYTRELMTYWEREYEKQVFYSLLPYQKWKDVKRHVNVQVGDVCLLMYPGKIQDRYRYCRVDEVHPDQDGVVRNVTVSLRCRNAREKLLLYKAKKPMKMEVGIQRLVLICPQEEIMNELDVGGDAKAENLVSDVKVNEFGKYDDITELESGDDEVNVDFVMKKKVVVKVGNSKEMIKDIKKAKHGSARSHYQAVQVATFERQ